MTNTKDWNISHTAWLGDSCVYCTRSSFGMWLGLGIPRVSRVEGRENTGVSTRLCMIAMSGSLLLYLLSPPSTSLAPLRFPTLISGVTQQALPSLPRFAPSFSITRRAQRFLPSGRLASNLAKIYILRIATGLPGAVHSCNKAWGDACFGRCTVAPTCS